MTNSKNVVRAALLASLAVSFGASCASGGGGGGGASVSPLTPPASPPAAPPAAPPASPPAAPPAAPPPPPPPPPPPATNSNLLGPLVTEEFSSTSYTGGRTFAVPSGATSNAFVSKPSTEFKVRYNADAGTYTLVTPTMEQTFRPGDITSENTSARLFTRDDGAGVKDYLALSKPGTSGTFNMKYVGGGMWLREVDEGSQIKGVANVFTYGIETSDTAVPRVGQAVYQVGLGGSSGTKSYNGTGFLSADFLSGGFLTTVQVSETEGGVLSPTTFSFVGSGDISSSSNLFSGSFTLNTAENHYGKLDGRFYGPFSEEVGVAFAGLGSSPGDGLAGYLIGRRSAGILSKNVSVQNLFITDTFTGFRVETSHANSIATGAHIDAAPAVRGNGLLNYVHTQDSYKIACCTGGSPTFLPTEKVASADARYSVYDQGDGNRFFLYTPGASNPDLQLTYASFAVLETVSLDVGADRKTTHRTYTPWGIVATNIPTTGSATYTGRVYGTGTSASAAYELTGDASLNVNFLASTLTGLISPDGRNLANDAIVDFGSFGIDSTALNANGTFSGTIDTATFGVFSNFSGALYGHEGKEFGAAFTGIQGTDPAFIASPVTLSGVALGRVN